MPIFPNLLEASFKGVPFLTNESGTVTGRKLKVFEYPNSSRRTVEDLGLYRKTFNLPATIQAPNYQAKKDALLRAFESEGSGQLIHPYFGIVNVFAKPVNVNEGLSKMNVLTVNVTFLEVTETVPPISTEFKNNEVFDQADITADGLAFDIGDTLDISNAFNYSDSLNISNEITNTFDLATTPFVATDDALNTYVNTFNTFRSTQSVLLSNPVIYADALHNLFRVTNSLGPSSRNSYEISKKFFNFAEHFIRYIPFTFQQVRRLSNQTLLINSVRTFGLINAYKNAIDIEYSDLEELKTVTAELELQYQNVSDLNFEDSLVQGDQGDFSNQTFFKLNKLRKSAEEALEEKIDNLADIRTVRTSKKSLLPFVYAYYGDLNNIQSIIDINNFPDPTLLEGEVNILETVVEPTR